MLYGSNFGTAEDIAHRIAGDADAHGFATNVAPLDDYVGELASEGAVIIVAATYNGTPPDNAVRFMEWLQARWRRIAVRRQICRVRMRQS